MVVDRGASATRGVRCRITSEQHGIGQEAPSLQRAPAPGVSGRRDPQQLAPAMLIVDCEMPNNSVKVTLPFATASTSS